MVRAEQLSTMGLISWGGASKLDTLNQRSNNIKELELAGAYLYDSIESICMLVLLK